MVRSLRIEYEGAFYHVTSRGNHQNNIFDDEDRASYEERKTSDEDFWSSSETTTKAGQSSNVGSSITGGNISLTSTSGDITVVGSDVAASMGEKGSSLSLY